MKTEGFRPPPDNLTRERRKVVLVSTADTHPLPVVLQRSGAALVEFRWEREPSPEEFATFLAEARSAHLVVIAAALEPLLARDGTDLSAISAVMLTTDEAVRTRLAAAGARVATIPSDLSTDDLLPLVRRALQGEIG